MTAPGDAVRALTLVLLSGALSACETPAADSADPLAAERSFALAHAEAACALYDRCGLLDEYGSSLESCTADLEAATLAHVTEDACSFDADAGEACVAEFDAASCEAQSETPETACAEVCSG